MGPDPRDWPFDLTGAFPGADRSDLGGQRQEQPDLYFAYGFVVANGWILQNPSINGYSGGFGYNPADGVTIVVGATESETATTDASAFDILRDVVKYVTPASPINF
jgi:D-alanyl-D-alanine carboxypeptidase